MNQFLVESNSNKYPAESFFFKQCLEIRPELSSTGPEIDIENELNNTIKDERKDKEEMIESSSTQLPKPLLVLSISDVFDGNVIFPEINMKIPNKLSYFRHFMYRYGGKDGYELVGLVAEKNGMPNHYYTIILHEGVYYKLQDSDIMKAESFQVNPDIP